MQPDQQRAPLVLGIDLGNAHCRMAGLRHADGEPIHMDDGGAPYPAVAALDMEGEWLFGRSALEAAHEPGVTLYRALQEGILRAEAPTGAEVVRRLLRKLKGDFQTKCAARVANAVLCVPYAYTLRQRETLRLAAEEAPMPVAGLINEPDAVVLGYRLDERIRDREEFVLVFDAGATHCTASMLRVARKGPSLDIELLCEVPAVDVEGRPVGGNALDLRLFDAFDRGELPGVPSPGALDAQTRAQIRETLRDARHRLSWQDEVEFALPWDATRTGSLTEKDLRRRMDIDDAVIQALRRSVKDARPRANGQGLTPGDIHRVLVAGGLAQSPRLQALLDGFPTMEPAPEERFLERVFALGAARCAVLLAGLYPGLEFAPRHTPAFGLRLRDDTFDRVIPENAPVGFTGRRLYSLPAGEAYVLHLEVCQGFSARYLPRKGNHWRRFELTPPPTLTPGGAVDWKIEVEMTRLPDKIAVQVRNHTGGPATLAGAFEVPLE